MTESQLREAALYELRVTAAGDPVAAEDDLLMRNKYASLHAMLLKENLLDWALGEEIPAFAELPVTWMLAYFAASAFGISPPAVQMLEQNGALNLPPNRGGPSQAERILRRYYQNNFVYAPVRATYY